jgi:Uma2 family endonuclease
MIKTESSLPWDSVVNQNQLGCVFGAEAGFVIRRNPESVRAPDVAFLRRDRVPGDLCQEFNGDRSAGLLVNWS